MLGVKPVDEVNHYSIQVWHVATPAFCYRSFASTRLPVCPAPAPQVVLASGGGHLVYLEVGEGALHEAGHAQLDAEIACLDITPAGAWPRGWQTLIVGIRSRGQVVGGDARGMGMGLVVAGVLPLDGLWCLVLLGARGS